ncbi:MAG: hypothetical protein QMD82_06920 [bacterium]|nr:hypothetical protein [bacterium]
MQIVEHDVISGRLFKQLPLIKYFSFVPLKNGEMVEFIENSFKKIAYSLFQNPFFYLQFLFLKETPHR